MWSLWKIAVLLSGVSAAVAQSNRCIKDADGEHGYVDLNALHKASEDYVVTSQSNSQYQYYFNVCGQTVFQDATCGEGATVCEIKDSEALDVYGYLDTIELAWDGGYLVMTQTGDAECPFNKQNPYVSRIKFLCTHEEESVTLLTESYYQCLLEIEVRSPKACGVQVHYRCDEDNHQCIQDDSGKYASHTECSNECQAPPPPPPPPGTRFGCSSDNFTCFSVNNGPFHSLEDCTKQCVPIYRRYSCYNEMCVRDSNGPYKSEMDCAVVCAPPTDERWACGDNDVCTEDDTGPYSTESECETACKQQTLYYCDGTTKTCVEGSHGVADKATCEAVCAGSASVDTNTDNAFLAHIRGRQVPLSEQ